MGKDPARAFPSQTLSIRGSALVTSAHGRKGEMFPGLEPLCPFKKSCHLGHLCSLRHTTAHRYCQILFDSRSLRETGLSLPPKVNRPLWILQLFVETQVFLPFFFFSFLLGDFPLQVQSHPNLGWKGSQMQGGASCEIHTVSSLTSLQAPGGTTLPSSVRPLQDHPKPTFHTTHCAISCKFPTPHLALCPQAHRAPKHSQVWRLSQVPLTGLRQEATLPNAPP